MKWREDFVDCLRWAESQSWLSSYSLEEVIKLWRYALTKPEYLEKDDSWSEEDKVAALSA